MRGRRLWHQSEWSRVAAGALTQGATCVVAHRWPIVEGRPAATVDLECIDTIRGTANVAYGLRRRQAAWLPEWEARRPGATAPHYWAGLQVIGRSTSSPGAKLQNAVMRSDG